MTRRHAFFGVFDGAALRSTPSPADPDRRSAVLAEGVLRVQGDAGGAKPVFTATDARTGALVFGESALEVLEASGREARVDAVALHDYLATGRLLGDSQTLFAHVRSIPRGWRLEARGSSIALHENETAAVSDPGEVSVEESAEALRELLLQAVSDATRDGHVAISLSGGVDSSGLLACAARLRGGEPVEAFCHASAGMELPESLNELPWAERAAAASGARLHRVVLRADEVPGLVAEAVALQDFPFGGPVIVAQGKLFAAMAEAGCDIVLGGHGPEILFGGSNPQAAMRAAELARAGRLFAAGRVVAGASRQLPSPKRDLLRAALGYLAGGPAPRSRGSEPAPWASSRWFTQRMAGALVPAARSKGAAALIDDLLTNSVGATSLLHEDRNAAGRGLDARQPYLSAAIVAFAKRLPLSHGISPRGEAKQVLRLALRGLVPQPILDRRERVGFAVPALSWLLENRTWAQARFRELGSLPFFAGPSVEEAWAGIEAGGMRGWTTAFRVWRWLVLLEWVTARNARFE